jgi:hypothetical protein
MIDDFDKLNWKEKIKFVNDQQDLLNPCLKPLEDGNGCFKSSEDFITCFIIYYFFNHGITFNDTPDALSLYYEKIEIKGWDTNKVITYFRYLKTGKLKRFKG